MGEVGGLETDVANQWIPDNLFMKRDLIPVVGMGTSLVRIFKTASERGGSGYVHACRVGLRLMELVATVAYNGLFYGGAGLIYNGMTG